MEIEQDLLGKLNNVQKEIVTTTEGPVMVMAGAGSGKTRVLTHRIAYIIKQKNVYPSNILAVTFTNKAAREMKERLSRLLDMNTNSMWISTFHSFCARLLRMEMDKMSPFNKKFVIIDEDDSIKIIKECLKEHQIGDTKASTIKNIISKEKNLEEVVFENPRLKYVYNLVAPDYKARLERENLLDFDDLILKTIQLFKAYPDVLEKYQQKFQYIMVDEFQDTNVVQYELMHLLALDHHNIFVVGDQDQSIYSFRGAKIENIDLFRKDFLETKLILLTENYRSTKPILDMANRVIDNNNGRIKKNLFTSKPDGNEPMYFQANSSFEEVMFVVDKIKELRFAGYDYGDFAIIYRQNSLSRNVEDAFVRYQIPYVIYGGISFFGRKEIKDVIAYMRLILNKDDDFSFKRIVNEPKRKIGNALIDKLTNAAIEHGTSLFNAIDLIEPSGIGYNNLLEFKFKILELYEAISNVELPKVVDIIIDKTGYLDMLKAEGSEGEDRIDNVLELKSVLKESDEFYEGTNYDKLESLLSDLALRTDVDNVKDSDDVVKLMTYHQSKGLEFKVVFLIAMEEEIFPSRNSLMENNLAEERRICYVGITRAEERLYITSARSRFMYGNQMFSVPSRFIKEMGLAKNSNASKVFKKFDDVKPFSKTNPFVDNKKETKQEAVSFKVGDKINHKAFGDGLVTQVDGNIIVVAFKAPFGIKKLISTHPSIMKK